jgi:16S rRNA (guanine527-N7)-methyltransferase
VTPAPSPPPEAVELFGVALPLAQRYAELLVGPGVERGLIGPREHDRMWTRHLLNCARVAPAVPVGAQVVDVGSGAGLPGLPLALARPDLQMMLVEPLLRRSEFLHEVVADLGLPVTVRRCRGEQIEPASADVVVARAVAPLGRLARTCLPALRPGGLLVALKGRSAQQELADAGAELRRAGAQRWEVRVFESPDDEPTRAVVVVAGAAPGRRRQWTTAGGAR